MRKMSCISFIAIYILLFVVSANAQLKTPPVIEWQRSLGRIEGGNANAIQQTIDGGYIMAGGSYFHNMDVMIVKLTDTGSVQWERFLGGRDSDEGYSIQQTNDSGYIVAGTSSSNDNDVFGNRGGSDYWIVKLNDKGAIQWQKTLGGRSFDNATSIQQTEDGGYIVAGSSKSRDGDVTDHHHEIYDNLDYWVVKLNNSGSIEWQRSLGGSEDDIANSIIQTQDGGYIVAGRSHSTDGDVKGNHGWADYWIVKLNSTGTVEWQRPLGGTSLEEACSIQQTVDRGYIVAGFSASIDSDITGHHGTDHYDVWVIKLNDSGAIEWQRSLGGSDHDVANSISTTKDGGYIVAGSSSSNDIDVSGHHGDAYYTDCWVVKLNSTGYIEWQKSIGGSMDDAAKSVQQTKDGGYIIAGYSNSNDGDVAGNSGFVDAWIVKLSPEGTSSVKTGDVTTQTATITPNPATSSGTLSLESDEEGTCEVQIISVTGITLKQYSTRLVAGKQEIALRDLESLPSGMYEVLVKRNGYVVEQTKLIIE